MLLFVCFSGRVCAIVLSALVLVWVLVFELLRYSLCCCILLLLELFVLFLSSLQTVVQAVVMSLVLLLWSSEPADEPVMV